MSKKPLSYPTIRGLDGDDDDNFDNNDDAWGNGSNLSWNRQSNKKPQGQKKCCGSYPDRFPFKTYGNDRQCCVDRTYDATVYQCCNDGSLAIGVCSP